MSSPEKKKQRGGDCDTDGLTFSSLSIDVLSNIFGHLSLEEIMRLRRVSKKSCEAAKETMVPLGESNRYHDYFKIDSIEKYNALIVMAEVLPGLSQISIDDQSYVSMYLKKEGEFKYVDGEDPEDTDDAGTAEYITLDIADVLSKFPNLHALDISSHAPLNGRYPSFFRFSHLEKLTITSCDGIKFDFGMLAGLPSLKIFECVANKLVTGSLSSLSVCKDTLESIRIADGGTINGNLMDLANFKRLMHLDLYNTKGISGNLGDMDADNGDHFPMLEKLLLPSTVIGGCRYEVMHVADAKQLIKDLTPLRRKRPELFKDLDWKLSEESPDIMSPNEEQRDYDFRQYAFFFVQDGSYLGWMWEEKFYYTPDRPFEVQWLDHPSSSVAKRFVPKGTGRFYKGYYEPPSYNVYNRLCRSYRPSAEEANYLGKEYTFS